MVLLHVVTTLGFLSLFTMMSWWASRPASGAAVVVAMSGLALAVGMTLAFLVWQDGSKTERLVSCERELFLLLHPHLFVVFLFFF